MQSRLHLLFFPDAGNFAGVGDFEVDVAEAVEPQLGGDGAQGGVGRVAVGAEVREEDVFEHIGGALGNKLCGTHVGEVALSAADALLERPRARGFLQEVFVVVGFNDDRVASLELFAHQRGGHSEIGDNTNGGF